METSDNTIVLDNYLGLLKSLSKENKLKLVEKLIHEITKEADKKEDVVDKFFGAFKSDKSAEEIIAEIRGSRSFNRTLESF
jgi:predicted metal-binding transcription factor (methanogenesis marker protein 9)